MHRSFQVSLVVTTWVLLALSFVYAEYLHDQPLQHIPTVLALIGLGRMARIGGLGDASMVCIFLFIWLHILGARYIYSFVPYDDWSRRWFGFSVSQTFHFTRNHYDRFVHFAYGVLAVIQQVELLRRACGLGNWSAHAFSVVLVLAAGALYEIFEWGLAMVMARDWADRYNGQQGDMWDSQKDMALALVGALLMAAVMFLIHRRKAAENAG